MQELGIPTANLSEDSIGGSLGSAVTGIYYGWASVGPAAVAHQMVMSVGFNPFYQNSIKTCEPWLLHEFAEVRTVGHMHDCFMSGVGSSMRTQLTWKLKVHIIWALKTFCASHCLIW